MPVVPWFHVWDSERSTSTDLFALSSGLCLTGVGEPRSQGQMAEIRYRIEVATNIWPESDTRTLL